MARRRGASPQALPEALSGVSPLQTTRKSIYKKYVDNVDNVDNSQGLYLIFTTTPKSIIRDKNVVKLTSPYPILTYLLPSLVHMSQDQDWSLCDKDCSRCGHCAESYGY